MLFRAIDLTPHEVEVHKRIDDLRKRLRNAVQPRRWTGLLSRFAAAKALQGSNSIEGYHVSDEDAVAAVDGEEPIETPGKTWAAVRGYQEAMTYVLQLSDDLHFKYSDDLIRGLHFMIMKYTLDYGPPKHPGRYRPGPIYVRNEATKKVVYDAPDDALIPELVTELVSDLSEASALPPMIRAAMAHLNLVMIHPFSDGNGRMARCLQTMVLAREEILSPEFCSIEEYLWNERADYYAVLSDTAKGAWHPENDTSRWIRFCLIAHYRQAMRLLRRTRQMQRVWDEVEQLIASAKLPERMVASLVNVTMRPQNGIRNPHYRHAAGVPEHVATRDLKMLADHGFIVTAGERKGRRYFPGLQLQEIWKKVREAERGPEHEDPFASETDSVPGLQSEAATV